MSTGDGHPVLLLWGEEQQGGSAEDDVSIDSPVLADIRCYEAETVMGRCRHALAFLTLKNPMEVV